MAYIEMLKRDQQVMAISQTQETHTPISHDERAFFAQLLALNTFFESARIGESGLSVGSHAQSFNKLLRDFLNEIQAAGHLKQ